MCWAPERHPERLRATYRRTQGIGYLFGSYDLEDDRLHGLYRRSRSGADFLTFLIELREQYNRHEKLHIICDNLSTHTTPDVRAWLPDNNARLVLLPTYSSWLNRIEGHFAAIRSFVISGPDYPDHETIERELLPYIDWRNQHRHHPKRRQADKRGCFH
jgi:transposase